MHAELKDILSAEFPAYAETHTVSCQQKKAVRHITTCRTSALGAHKDTCDSCGFIKISYNSCRDRHCPKCQAYAKEVWIDNQIRNLLNVHYFHVVFTVPSELNELFFHYPQTMFNLLFRASSETVLELCNDKKYLGACPGITAILHTWGQNIQFHPHIHMVVSGGGLTTINTWRCSKKSFFLPTKVLSSKFRGKFMALLRENIQDLDPTLVSLCYRKKWVVYCKPPFGNAAQVVSYLGRYTHRVAISNDRILNYENGKVTFLWRNYANHNEVKPMTLTADEFIRRYLLHILPPSFRKIRHYGLFASRDKTKRINLCRRLTHTRAPAPQKSPIERLVSMLGKDFNLCPNCKTGHMLRDPPEKL